MPENNSKMDNSNQSSENLEKEIKAIYKLSIETRNFEINNLIQRNNFYMLFHHRNNGRNNLRFLTSYHNHAIYPLW